MADVRLFSVLPDKGDSKTLRSQAQSPERVSRAERLQPQELGLDRASGFYLLGTTDQVCGTVSLRAHSHRVAHSDFAAGAALAFLFALTAAGLACSVLALFASRTPLFRTKGS